MNLNQVTIPSLDLTKSVEFYQTLGLKLIVGALPRYARFVCPGGDSTFSVHLVEKLPNGEGVSFYFESENLDQEYDRLVNEGLKFDLSPTDQDWLWREARLKDPDGNSIILFYGGENRINPPWRIN
ncbi:MAG: catechol 2,3-dioxygenase-like lactoylglutathione lyase family enzyme [Cyclobacteriaceae bacterium]|jgi:catechol 2,3-dioxygenase-like lactoylglutathione lyase family enzyme